MSNSVCPTCKNFKRPWFDLCFKCSEKKKKIPTCDICEIEVIEGHNLCKKHWLEKQEAKKEIGKVSYVKNKKEENFREKFQGKFFFEGNKFKSKSEVIIYMFLKFNGLHNIIYEQMIAIEEKTYYPDFTVFEKVDGKEKSVIIEYFGLDDREYLRKAEEKIYIYKEFCKVNDEIEFIWVNEQDMENLKDRLGKKLNGTCLKRTMWK